MIPPALSRVVFVCRRYCCGDGDTSGGDDDTEALLDALSFGVSHMVVLQLHVWLWYEVPTAIMNYLRARVLETGA